MKQKVLRYCSLALLPAGANFFAETRLMKLIRFMMLANFVLSMSSSIGTLYSSWNNGVTFSSLANTTLAVSRIIAVAFLVKQRKQIEEFLSGLVEVIPGKDLRRILWIIYRLTPMAYLIIALKSIESVLFLSTRNFRLSFILWKLTDDATSCWVAMTCSTYAVALHMLFFFINQQTCVLQRKLISSPNILHTIRSYTTAVEEQHERFEKLFSLMPFLWFFSLVVETPRTVYILSRTNLVDFLLLFSWIVNGLVCPVCVCFLISSFESVLSRSIDRIHDFLFEKCNMQSSDRMEAISVLKSVKSIQFTGLSFFALNRSFVLSLTGTLFTVSALLDQYMKGG